MGQAQTVILPFGQPAGYAGQPWKLLDTVSAANKEASASIRFGIGVKPGVNVSEALLPTASSSILFGITTNVQVYAPGTFGNVDSTGMIPNTMMQLGVEGRMFALVASDTTAGVDVGAYWVFETGGLGAVGSFRDTDDGHTVDTTKQVRFRGFPFSAVNVLTGGTEKICELYVSTSNKP